MKAAGAIATGRLATAPARGGIAVIVLTGPGCRDVLDRVFRPHGQGPRPGRLALGRIADGEQTLDEAVVSLEGDRAEINIHGGPHVARRVLSLLGACGVAIGPDDQIDPALLPRAGGPANPAVAREMLVALRSAATPLAASAVTAQWRGGLSALAALADPDPARLAAAAAALPLMRRLLVPAEVVVAGPPNAGKNALTNALVGRNVAIVSQTPGTTRDWVRTLTDADGVPLWLTDTAGLWQQASGVDAEAVRRAWERIASADLVICLTSPDQRGDAGLADRFRRLPRALQVSSKCDMIAENRRSDLAVSARTLEGLATLRQAIRACLGFKRFDPSAPMAFTERQPRLLTAAADAAERGDRPACTRLLVELLAGPPA